MSSVTELEATKGRADVSAVESDDVRTFSHFVPGKLSEHGFL